MRKAALKTAAGAARALGGRRMVKAVAFAVAGVAVAVAVGTTRSNAQYPPSVTPTTTSPSTSTTTSPAPTASPTPAKNTVVIKGTSVADYRFSPRSLRVKRGRRVRWTWSSNAPHNVTFRKLHKRSKTAQRGSYRLRFRRRGTFRYLCTVHGFTGKIVVR